MVFLGVMLLSFMATHTPLVEKVAVIRHQLGLAEGLNVADTVAEAVKQLGLVGEVAGRDLIQRADACLVMLRLPAETMPTPEQREPDIALHANDTLGIRVLFGARSSRHRRQKQRRGRPAPCSQDLCDDVT